MTYRTQDVSFELSL